MPQGTHPTLADRTLQSERPADPAPATATERDLERLGALLTSLDLDAETLEMLTAVLTAEVCDHLDPDS